MHHVRFNHKPARSFNNLMDDFFTQVPSLFRDDFSTVYGQRNAPVNIRETENDFVLELVAPGLEKEDFKINLDKNQLTISAERKAATEPKAEGKQIMKEFSLASFKRSFTIDDKIDASNIAAKYANGILTLNLPKKAEVKEAAKEISIQ